MGLSYRVDGREFLDRRSRAAAVLARIAPGRTFDVQDLTRDWQAIVNEVPEIPFVSGRKYRIRFVAGKATVRHVHLADQSGQRFGLDMPSGEDPTFQERDARFVQRLARLPGGGSSTLWLAGEEQMLLGDIDVLEADELDESGR